MDSKARAELYARDTNGLEWMKSAVSSHFDDPPDCVEVATYPDGAVALRDSKRPGEVLFFAPTEWAAFAAAMRGEVSFVS